MPQTAKNDDANYRVPEGRRPEEFMNDAQLLEHAQRDLGKLAENAPSRKAALRRLAAAQRAAAITASVDPDTAD